VLGLSEELMSMAAKITGVTIHFIDEEIDHGPIILQRNY